MSCLNEIIYRHEDIIQAFLKEYGTKNVLKNEVITYSIGEWGFLAARKLYYKLKDNPAFALEFEQKKLEEMGVSIESLQNRIFLAFTRGTTDTVILLKEFFEAIEEYTANTINSMLTQQYIYTLEQFADMLCIEPKYITNNFMQYLDYIELPNFVRYVIKEEIENGKERVQDLQNDTLYWRKHIFISRASILNFLVDNFKYTEIKINITIDYKGEKFEEVLLVYKTKAKLKKQIKNLIKILDTTINKDLKSITKEEASDIIDKRIIIDSANTLKKFLKIIREIKLDVSQRQYSHVTIEDTQLYNFLNMQSHKRYQLEVDGIANEMYVRYHLYDITDMEGIDVNCIMFNMNQEIYNLVPQNETLEDFLISIL